MHHNGVKLRIWRQILLSSCRVDQRQPSVRRMDQLHSLLERGCSYRDKRAGCVWRRSRLQGPLPADHSACASGAGGCHLSYGLRPIEED